MIDENAFQKYLADLKRCDYPHNLDEPTLRTLYEREVGNELEMLRLGQQAVEEQSTYFLQHHFIKSHYASLADAVKTMLEEGARALVRRSERNTVDANPDVNRYSRKATELLLYVDHVCIAIRTIHTIFTQLITRKEVKKNALIMRLGRDLEDEARGEFNYRKINNIDSQLARAVSNIVGNKSKKIRQRVEQKLEGHEIRWVQWRKQERINVGVKLLDIVHSTGIIIESDSKQHREHKEHQPAKIIEFNATVREQCSDMINYLLQAPTPKYMPMLCPPRPWFDARIGGYLDNELTRTKLISRGRLEGDEYESLHAEQIEGVNAEEMPVVFNAVNWLQAVQWRINKPMLKIILQIWNSGASAYNRKLDAEKAGRRGKKHRYRAIVSSDTCLFNISDELLIARSNDLFFGGKEPGNSESGTVEAVLQQAIWLADHDRFWLPTFMDFRGRIYYRGLINPQGTDYVRALLEFAQADEVDDERALAGYGATMYGKRVAYGDRLEWATGPDRVEINIRESCYNPHSCRDWENAKEPFQFLNWCRSYLAYKEDWGPSQGAVHWTHMPMYIDATCSVLQIVTALTKDEQSARLVNLINNPVPQDVYQTVAGELTKMLNADGSDMAQRWLKVWSDLDCRSLVKRPIMIFFYGAGNNTRVRRIIDKSRKHKEALGDHREASEWLLDKIDDAFRMVGFDAAEKCMDWLRAVAKISFDAGQHLEWSTPSGFIVRQRYFKTESKGFKALGWYGKEVRLKLKAKTDQLDKKSVAAYAPNFIHSLDAGILHHTVNRLANHTHPNGMVGIRNVGCVHDCLVGTEASVAHGQRNYILCLAGLLAHDVIDDLYLSIAKKFPDAPPPPPRGNLCLNAHQMGSYVIS
ncbi:MAG: hypothetical protein HJJLKODD_02518 [Phycisphaerae bacterium]|nr:hypothetical protein [Phycisphaerae bacterium]